MGSHKISATCFVRAAFFFFIPRFLSLSLSRRVFDIRMDGLLVYREENGTYLRADICFLLMLRDSSLDGHKALFAALCSSLQLFAFLYSVSPLVHLFFTFFFLQCLVKWISTRNKKKKKKNSLFPSPFNQKTKCFEITIHFIRMMIQ